MKALKARIISRAEILLTLPPSATDPLLIAKEPPSRFTVRMVS